MTWTRMLGVVVVTAIWGGATPAGQEVTVRGMVRYADGRPAATCQVKVLHPGFEPMHEARCAEDGSYALTLPPGRYNGIAILDEGYGESTLEFWAWNLHLTADTELSATLDRLEVYNLALWNSKGGPPSIFIAFRPMSLDRYLAGAAPEPRDVGGRTLPVLDIAPALDSASITILVDGEPTAVEAVQTYYERVPAGTGDGAHWLPNVVVQAVRPPLSAGVHRVRVRLRDAETGALGEAATSFVSNEAGFGF